MTGFLVYCVSISAWGKWRFRGLTHTVTHMRKNADGDNGWERAKDHAPPQQKGPESAEQWHSQGWQSVGKDEDPSSNLGSSSTKNRLNRDI